MSFALLGATVLVGCQQADPPGTMPTLQSSSASLAPQPAREPERKEMVTDTPLATVHTLAAMEAAGTTIVSARFVHHSLEHYLEQVHALAELHRQGG